MLIITEYSRDIEIKDADQRHILERMDLAQLQATEALASMNQDFRDLVHTLQNRMSSGTAGQTMNPEGKRQTFVEEMLESLHFETIHARQEDVRSAYKNTFSWILDPNQKDSYLWDNLLEWLETGSGIYWINGKAGSGKSTVRMQHPTKYPAVEFAT